MIFEKDVANPGVQNILKWGSELRFLFTYGAGFRGGGSMKGIKEH